MRGGRREGGRRRREGGKEGGGEGGRGRGSREGGRREQQKKKEVKNEIHLSLISISRSISADGGQDQESDGGGVESHCTGRKVR